MRCPTRFRPMNLIVGALLKRGVGAGAGTFVAMSTVGPETAFVLPERFVAVTTTRSVLPTSAERTPYDFAVASGTDTQAAPCASQRCHWYENERTPPVQVPVVASSSSPTFGVPEMPGAAVLVGPPFEETTSETFDVAELEPSAFVAVTCTRSVLSASPEVTVYVFCVAPLMLE